MTAWIPRKIANTLSAAAAKQDFIGSGYIAAVLTQHALAIDLLAAGMDGHQIARMLRMSYADIMKVMGREIDEAVAVRK